MYVLAWTSGHTPPRTMYFTEYDQTWGAGEDVAAARKFKTAAEAIQMYRTRCTAWPDNEPYVSAVKTGRVRAERIDQGSLLL